jgi:hypothetical protein
MKTISTYHTMIKSADRDIIIGRALSRALTRTAPVEPCTTTEQMAAFLDETGMQEEQDRFLAHLATCDRCREIYILAHDLSKPEVVRHDQRRWFMAGGALAAVALVILAVKLTIQQPVTSGQQVAQAPAPIPHVALSPPAQVKPQAAQPFHGSPSQPPRPAPFTYGIAARQLAHTATPDDLAAAIGTPASGSYGFAGSGSRQGTVFKAGKELFELELWLAAGDKERAGLAGERLAPLLRSIGEGTTLAPLNDLLRNLEADSAPVHYENIASQLESLLKTGDHGIVRLGGWAAAAKLANEVGKDPYFAGNPPQSFLKELGGNISPAAQAVLKKLEKKQIGKNPEQMRRLLDELANSM